MKENTDDKFVVLINKKIPEGTAFNAVGHLMAALVHQASPEERERMCFTEYFDADRSLHMVSGLSLIVLKARNSGQLLKVRREALGLGVLVSDFVETMTGGTTEEQIERTRCLSEDELNYYSLGLFGPKTIIDTLTGKFSLWR